MTKRTLFLVLLSTVLYTAPLIAASKLGLNPPSIDLAFATTSPPAATLTLARRTDGAIVYEVQRRSGRMSWTRRWRTVGVFPAGQEEWADLRPPARSKWRVRALDSSTRSPFSNVVPP